MAWVRGSAAL
jgi:hypothetical protein